LGKEELVDRERLIAWAKRKGPNTPYRGKPPALRALEAGDARLLTELLRMGSDIPGVGLGDYLRLGRDEDTLELLRVLAERLAEALSKDPRAYPLTVEEVVRAGIGLGGEHLLALRPLAGLKPHLIAREAASAGSLEAFRALEEWSAPYPRGEAASELIRSTKKTPEDASRRLEALGYLLEKGAPTEGLLHLVLVHFPEEKVLEGMELLLRHGADPFEKAYGKHLTAYCRTPEALRLLLDLGVPFEGGMTPLRLLCLLDPRRAVREAVRMEETLRKGDADRPVYMTFLRLVQEEEDEEKALGNLGLFEGVRLGVDLVGPGDFRGGLGKLLKVASWLAERGYLLSGGWVSRALRLGAGEEELGFLLERMEPDAVPHNVRWAWESVRKGRSTRELGLLAWLSQRTGFVGEAILQSRPLLLEYLEAGGNPGARVVRESGFPDRGDTLLHLVRDPGLIRLLVQKGADVDARNGSGETPLHLAVPDWRAAEALLECGANPLIRDNRGMTPMEIAEAAARFTGDKRYLEFARRLSRHPAYRRAVMLQDLGRL